MLKNLMGVLALFIASQGFSQDSITLESIWRFGKYRQDNVYGFRSTNSGDSYTILSNEGKSSKIVQFSYATGEQEAVVIDGADERINLPFSDYSISSDERYVLLQTDVTPIYRRSTKANFYLWDNQEASLQHLSKSGKQSFTTLAPGGKHAAYVQDNNLFLYDVATHEHVQVTSDGKANEVINGATDWVYEEEFAFAKAFFWSPKGDQIAYYRFDERAVPQYNMQTWGNDLYPNDYLYKYPKAGEPNSVVSIWVYNLKTNTSKKLTETGVDYEYIPRIKWTTDNATLALQLMNRHQSTLHIFSANTQSGELTPIYKEQSDTYIDVTDDWTFMNDGKSMLISSEKDGYNHLYLVNMQTQTARALTSGDWEIKTFYGVDADDTYAYFAAAKHSPMDRGVYRLNLKKKRIEALTSETGMSHATFSTGMKYFINTRSTANTPNEISLHRSTGKLVRVLKSSKRLNEVLKTTLFSKKTFFSFETSEGVKLNAWKITPPDFDADKKYPVLLTIYGGPGSQEVVNQWGGANFLWHQMLAQQGYIVVSVDNRGTGGRGAAFKKITYKQLGHYETIDYIETAKYLQSLNYVDSSRIGIWGWSYGGYMSSLAITKGASYFKSAIAVAPVTTWRYYDNIYTERYMQTPQENETGYDNNSPINYTDQLKGNYLLVHGTGDDNVHFQNAIQMINALVRSNKQFDLHVYPDRNHGIYGGNTRYHLYKKMTDWLHENL